VLHPLPLIPVLTEKQINIEVLTPMASTLELSQMIRLLLAALKLS